MRLSKKDIDTKIVKLYKGGYSFRQLQKRYPKSPNYIAKLVKGIAATRTADNKPKDKDHSPHHNPDRINQPGCTIPLYSSCHVIEDAKLKRERENKLQLLSLFSKTSAASIKTENVVSEPSSLSISFPRELLSPKEKKILTVTGITLVVNTLFPGFFERRWQEIQDHWQRQRVNPNRYGKR